MIAVAILGFLFGIHVCYVARSCILESLKNLRAQ